MPATFQPLGPRCLIQPLPAEKLSEIIITPVGIKEQSDQAIVVAMGTEPYGHGKVKDANAGQLVQLRAGDRVLFQKYTGSEFKLGGVDYRVLLYDEILGIIHQTTEPIDDEPSRILSVSLGTN